MSSLRLALAPRQNAVRYAVLSGRVPLRDLGRDNAELAAALQPVDLSGVIAPGEPVGFDLPGEVAPGSVVVLAYEVSSEGSNAVVTNYVQTVVQ